MPRGDGRHGTIPHVPAPRPNPRAVIIVGTACVVGLAAAFLVSGHVPTFKPSPSGKTAGTGSATTTNPAPYEPPSFPLAGTDDDPASADAAAVDLLGAPGFRFTFGDGSGLSGYDVLTVGADGACQYTTHVTVSTTNPSGDVESKYGWRRATFTLAPQTVTELRTLLKDIDFFRLKKAYHADVHDGTQRWARVEASGKRKGVYWNNHFPDHFERLHQFVKQKILGAHRAEILASEPVEVDPKELETPMYD